MNRAIGCLVLSFVLLAGDAHAGGGDAWKKTLSDSLYPGVRFTLTKTSLSMNQIKQPGTVMVMKKDGLSGTKAGEGFAANIVREGAISQKGSMANMLLGGGANRRDFHVGDKFYVTAVAIKDKQLSFDMVSFTTYDVTTNGNTKSERYSAQLQFEFPEGVLPAMPPAKVQEVLDAVFIDEGRMQSAPAATVSLGQTFTQVEQVLGKPERIVNLGSKVTWIYKDMKVIFMDEKVADVQ